MILKRISFSLFALLFTSTCYAKEITILFTGDTHAMLYPCSCPVESDGGVARRATLIKEMRKTSPNLLLLDSGSFFASGQLDEYTQNTALDTQRTQINLKAMGLMRYDAACVGDDEFNFGKEFLEEASLNSNFVFLSCNIRSGKLRPYVIKEVEGVKVGIIGLTNQRAANKTTGLGFIEPPTALKTAIEELKKEGAGLIVVLSRLGEEQDAQLISQIPGIDVLISVYAKQNAGPMEKSGSTFILRPSWQGRYLGKAILKLKGDKIIDLQAEKIPLSAKISDDAKISSILPRCFRDSDCKKEGAVGTCLEPDSIKAQCQFSQAKRVSVLVIEPKNCIACGSKNFTNQLKNIFPGSVISYLYYPDDAAKKIIEELGLKNLPSYLFVKEVEQDKKFPDFKERFEIKGNYYLVKPQYSGISFFLERKKTEGSLDLFISLFIKDAPSVLDSAKNFHPRVHFLATENNGNFDTYNGKPELEEDLRAVCVEKYYPDKFWNYISCRAKNITSTWWEDCLSQAESAKIKTCAKSQQAKDLLKENIRMNKEVQVMLGPTYLVNNQEIFGTQGSVSEKDLRKILKK